MGWLVKKHEASLTNSGCYPGARPLEDYIRNSIIVLDKPSGPTSNQVDNWIKQILNINCTHVKSILVDAQFHNK